MQRASAWFHLSERSSFYSLMQGGLFDSLTECAPEPSANTAILFSILVLHCKLKLVKKKKKKTLVPCCGNESHYCSRSQKVKLKKKNADKVFLILSDIFTSLYFFSVGLNSRVTKYSMNLATVQKVWVCLILWGYIYIYLLFQNQSSFNYSFVHE